MAENNIDTFLKIITVRVGQSRSISSRLVWTFALEFSKYRIT